MFVAPGLLATSAMNGAIFDATFNFFFKIKYVHTYDAMLATPLSPTDVASGEVLWSLIRGAIYSASFLATMAALGPGPVVVDGARPARHGAHRLDVRRRGLAATTYMRSFVDFDYVNLAIVPLFLFSATFFPIERYPRRCSGSCGSRRSTRAST